MLVTPSIFSITNSCLRTKEQRHGSQIALLLNYCPLPPANAPLLEKPNSNKPLKYSIT